MPLFCWFHHSLDSRAEICQNFSLFYGKFKTSKIHSQSNWPLCREGKLQTSKFVNFKSHETIKSKKYLVQDLDKIDLKRKFKNAINVKNYLFSKFSKKWLWNKDGFISKSFSYWLESPKSCCKTYSVLYPTKKKGAQDSFWCIFWEIGAKVKVV